jgi:hypothetical protein
VTSPWVPSAVTGVVALAGILATWRTGQQARTHDVRLAREERRQDRLANAYVELLTMAERVGQWASMVRPFIDTTPPQPVPPLPDLMEQARAEALIQAYGSPAVQELAASWRDAVRAIIRADRTLGIAAGAREAKEPIDSGDTWRKLDMELRPAERASRMNLAGQVNAELRGESDRGR